MSAPPPPPDIRLKLNSNHSLDAFQSKTIANITFSDSFPRFPPCCKWVGLHENNGKKANHWLYACSHVYPPVCLIYKTTSEERVRGARAPASQGRYFISARASYPCHRGKHTQREKRDLRGRDETVLLSKSWNEAVSEDVPIGNFQTMAKSNNTHQFKILLARLAVAAVATFFKMCYFCPLPVPYGSPQPCNPGHMQCSMHGHIAIGTETENMCRRFKLRILSEWCPFQPNKKGNHS